MNLEISLLDREVEPPPLQQGASVSGHTPFERYDSTPLMGMVNTALSARHKAIGISPGLANTHY